MLKTINATWDALCKYDIDITFVALLIVGFILFIAMLRAHRNSESPFDFIDLLTERGPDGKRIASKIGCAFVGVFLSSTWLMIHLTWNNRMTEGYFTAYLAAWVAPLVAFVVWGKRPPMPPAEPPTGGPS